METNTTNENIDKIENNEETPSYNMSPDEGISIRKYNEVPNKNTYIHIQSEPIEVSNIENNSTIKKEIVQLEKTRKKNILNDIFTQRNVNVDKVFESNLNSKLVLVEKRNGTERIIYLKNLFTNKNELEKISKLMKAIVNKNEEQQQILLEELCLDYEDLKILKSELGYFQSLLNTNKNIDNKNKIILENITELTKIIENNNEEQQIILFEELGLTLRDLERFKINLNKKEPIETQYKTNNFQSHLNQNYFKEFFNDDFSIESLNEYFEENIENISDEQIMEYLIDLRLNKYLEELETLKKKNNNFNKLHEQVFDNPYYKEPLFEELKKTLIKKLEYLNNENSEDNHRLYGTNNEAIQDSAKIIAIGLMYGIDLNVDSENGVIANIIPIKRNSLNENLYSSYLINNPIVVKNNSLLSNILYSQRMSYGIKDKERQKQYVDLNNGYISLEEFYLNEIKSDIIREYHYYDRDFNNNNKELRIYLSKITLNLENIKSVIENIKKNEYSIPNFKEQKLQQEEIISLFLDNKIIEQTNSPIQQHLRGIIQPTQIQKQTKKPQQIVAIQPQLGGF